MIYTVTFNPSLDYVMKVKDFEEGKTNRSYQETINVSTILQCLGLENTALGFIAGFTGKEIEDQLKKRGFNLDLCVLDEGISRINVKMKSTKETEINGNGPNINNIKLDELLSKLDYLNSGDILILAGSIPSSLPDNIYEIFKENQSNC